MRLREFREVTQCAEAGVSTVEIVSSIATRVGFCYAWAGTGQVAICACIVNSILVNYVLGVQDSSDSQYR